MRYIYVSCTYLQHALYTYSHSTTYGHWNPDNINIVLSTGGIPLMFIIMSLGATWLTVVQNKLSLSKTMGHVNNIWGTSSSTYISHNWHNLVGLLWPLRRHLPTLEDSPYSPTINRTIVLQYFVSLGLYLVCTHHGHTCIFSALHCTAVDNNMICQVEIEVTNIDDD